MRKDQGESPETVRLDVWLWRARFFKTRSLCADHITRRGVRISRNGETRKVKKPGTNIAIGDIVTFGRSVHIRTVSILQLGIRRGPASEAAMLYEDLEESM